MLKNIRRNSKQFLESRRKSVASIPSRPDPDPSPTTLRPRTLTFFDLPAELRNAIYEHVAKETRILVPLPSKKPPKVLPPTPSLLLVSKQTRQEYLSLLLEHATIAFQVRDLDFHHVIRITGSLYSSELKSLRCNANLTIRLWLDKVDPDLKSMAALRRWLVNRSSALDRLNFEYAVWWPKHTQLIPTSTQVHKVNIYMQRRLVLRQNLGAMGESFLSFFPTCLSPTGSSLRDGACADI
jgi:hypothetical protein